MKAKYRKNFEAIARNDRRQRSVAEAKRAALRDSVKKASPVTDVNEDASADDTAVAA